MYMYFEQVVKLNSKVAKKIYDPKKHTWMWAAEKGELEVIKWLSENEKEGCNKTVIDSAATLKQ